MTKDHIETLPNKEVRNRSKLFVELMCIIHRDGGQYLNKHGDEKAFSDAIDKILPLIHGGE